MVLSIVFNLVNLRIVIDTANNTAIKRSLRGNNEWY